MTNSWVTRGGRWVLITSPSPTRSKLATAQPVRHCFLSMRVYDVEFGDSRFLVAVTA